MGLFSSGIWTGEMDPLLEDMEADVWPPAPAEPLDRLGPAADDFAVQMAAPAFEAEEPAVSHGSSMSHGAESEDLSGADADPAAYEAAARSDDEDAEDADADADAEADDGAVARKRQVIRRPAFLPADVRTADELQGFLDSPRSAQYTPAQIRQLMTYLRALRNRMFAAQSRVRRSDYADELEASIRTVGQASADLDLARTRLEGENEVLREQVDRMRRIIKSTALRRLATMDSKDLEMRDKDLSDTRVLALLGNMMGRFILDNPEVVARFSELSGPSLPT